MISVLEHSNAESLMTLLHHLDYTDDATRNRWLTTWGKLLQG